MIDEVEIVDILSTTPKGAIENSRYLVILSQCVKIIYVSLDVQLLTKVFAQLWKSFTNIVKLRLCEQLNVLLFELGLSIISVMQK